MISASLPATTRSLGQGPWNTRTFPSPWLVLASLGSSFLYDLSFSSHKQKITRSSGLFSPLILSKMDVVMENLFSGSVHINSFGDIKETPKGVKKQLECENRSDQNRVRQANRQAEASAVPYGFVDSSPILPQTYVSPGKSSALCEPM